MTRLLTDITVLNRLLALNLDISLWSARKKLTSDDFGDVELPPEDLASLGSKRICDPERLRVFNALKARAFNHLDRHGVRFLGGWAVPENKAEAIVSQLSAIRDEFNAQKETFLQEYDQIIRDWINRHTAWARIITPSTASNEYVRARMNFAWQLYRVAPLPECQSGIHAGLREEVERLGATLFDETARDANEIWRKSYAGKTEVMRKALSPLRTLRDKLKGLSFMEPHVAPVVDILDMTFSRMPDKGLIQGTELLLLQGVICLLRDPAALVEHSRTIMRGHGPETVLDALLRPMPEHTENVDKADALPMDAVCDLSDRNDGPEPAFSPAEFPDEIVGEHPAKSPARRPLAEPPSTVCLPSFGLW